jgi:hypothetical protein
MSSGITFSASDCIFGYGCYKVYCPLCAEAYYRRPNYRCPNKQDSDKRYKLLTSEERYVEYVNASNRDGRTVPNGLPLFDNGSVG